MMMLPFGIVMMLAMLGGTGGNELVDYLDTKSYWRVVDRAQVTDDELIAMIAPLKVDAADVAPLIEQLDAPDFRDRERAEQALRKMGHAATEGLRKASVDPRPEVSSRAESILQQIETDLAGEGIRRLMAMRTLGERQVVAARQPLEALARSDDPFVADHARRALVVLDGQKLPVQPIAAEARSKQLMLLPGNLGVVAQTTLPSTGSAVDLRAMLKPMAEQFGGDDRIELMIDDMTTGMLEVANRTGNIRVDLVTLGVSADIDNEGHGVVLVSGRWSASAVGAVLAEHVEDTRAIEGAMVYHTSDFALIIASDTQAAIVLSEDEQPEVWSSVASALRTGQGGFDGSDLSKLVRDEHTRADAWVVARMTESYKQEQFLAAFDDLWLTVRRQDGKSLINGSARGSDEQAIEQRLVEMKAGADEVLGQLRQMGGDAPQLKPALEFLESLELSRDATTIRASAEMAGDPQMLMGTMFMGFGVRARAVPPAAMEEVPAVAEPVAPAEPAEPVVPDR